MINDYFIVIIFTFFSNILGFLKEIFTAKYFGISSDLDVYLLSFTLINVFYLIFAAGSLQGAFIPKFLERYKMSEENGWNYFYNILFSISIISCILGLVAIFLSKSSFFFHIIAPGFNEFKIPKFNQFIIVLTVYMIFSNISIVFTSLLQALGRFGASSLPPILNNVTIILTMYLLHTKYQVYSLVIANVIGCLGGLLLQFLYIKIVVKKPKIRFSLNMRDVISFYCFIIPMISLVFVDQVDLLLQRAIVSTTGDGNIAALNYSYKLVSIPIGLLGASIATVAFPAISSLISSRSGQEIVKEKILNATNFLTYLLVPTTVFFVFFSLPIVKLFFERGEFSATVSVKVASGLIYYSLGILPQSLVVLYNRIFFAYDDSKTPLKVGILSAIIHILLCFYFVRLWGFIGIACATSLYALIYFTSLYILLHKKYVQQEHNLILKKVAKFSLISLFCILICDLSNTYLGITAKLGKLDIILYSIEFSFLYIIISFLFRIEESRVIYEFATTNIQGKYNKQIM